MELLNDIFLELVGTQYYYEELPIPPMPLEFAENKQDSLNYQIEKEKSDEAFDNPKLEKADLVIGIEPYHLNPKKEFKDWDTDDSSFPRMCSPRKLRNAFTISISQSSPNMPIPP